MMTPQVTGFPKSPTLAAAVAELAPRPPTAVANPSAAFAPFIAPDNFPIQPTTPKKQTK